MILAKVVAPAGSCPRPTINCVFLQRLLLRTASSISTPEAIDILISLMANMIYNSLSAPSRNPSYASRTAETHAGTTTSWLSLITSPPLDPRCSNHLYSPDGAYHTLIAFDPRLETVANITCYPQEAAKWYTQNNLPFGATIGRVTSLGPMICPNGYTTASTSRKDVTSTMVFCCPSNYDFATAADHGDLYGCTSMQTRRVTVHLAGSPRSIGTLPAGAPSRAPNVGGIAVNGWVFQPSPALTSTLATASDSDIWARKHVGTTSGKFTGLVVGLAAGLFLFLLMLLSFTRRKCFRRNGKADLENTQNAAIATRSVSASDEHVDPNPSRDVALSDLNHSGSRVPSAADTVVRHIEHSKGEGSSTDERTA